MTTSLPPLTLPHAVFAIAAPAVLMPVVLGSVVGVATGRELDSVFLSLPLLLRLSVAVSRAPEWWWWT
jgi:hypothetical protein